MKESESGGRKAMQVKMNDNMNQLFKGNMRHVAKRLMIKIGTRKDKYKLILKVRSRK